MTQLDGLDRVATANADVLAAGATARSATSCGSHATLGARARALAATTLAAEATVAELAQLRAEPRGLHRRARAAGARSTRRGSPQLDAQAAAAAHAPAARGTPRRPPPPRPRPRAAP